MRRMYRQVISGICCRLDYFQHLSSAESDTLHPTVIYLVLLIYLSKYNGPREPPDNYRKVVFVNGGCAVIVLKKRNKKKNIGLQIAWKLCSQSHTISLSLSLSLHFSITWCYQYIYIYMEAGEECEFLFLNGIVLMNLPWLFISGNGILRLLNWQ